MIIIAASIVNLMLLGGIIVVLKKGFNEIVSGIESLDERLNNIANKIDED